MRILCYAYRDWAIQIFKNLDVEKKFLINFDDYEIIENIKPDLIFFLGWSKIVPNEVINKYKCLCLHPSKLPEFRGGSPLQHQILAGKKTGAVTIFMMNEILDGGDIVYQEDFSLEYKLLEIFKEIEKIGTKLINKIILDVSNNSLKTTPQDLSNSLIYKRRKPKESEITIDEILNNEPIYLYNKIRALNDPYPNAYLVCKSGKKLFIIDSKYEK